RCRKRIATAPPAPQAPLRQGKAGSSAGWTDPLIVLGLAAGDRIVIAELALHLDQVLHVHARAKGVPAAPTQRGLLRAPRVLVETHAELRRPLEDVKELAEGEPEEG